MANDNLRLGSDEDNDFRLERLERLLENVLDLHESLDIPGITLTDINLSRDNLQDLRRELEKKSTNLELGVVHMAIALVDRLEELMLVSRALPIPSAFLTAMLREGPAIRAAHHRANIAFVDIEYYTHLTHVLGNDTILFVNDYIFRPLVQMAEEFNVELLEIQGDAAVLYTLRDNKAIRVHRYIKNALEYFEAVRDRFEDAKDDPVRLEREFGVHGVRLVRMRSPFRFKLRVGCSSGDVVSGVTGDYGSRIQWGMRGPAMNLPSRLQEIGKRMGATWVVDRTYLEAVRLSGSEDLGDSIAIRLPFRNVRDFPDSEYFSIIRKPGDRLREVLKIYDLAIGQLDDGHLEAAYFTLRDGFKATELPMYPLPYNHTRWNSYVQTELEPGEGVVAYALREMEERYERYHMGR